MVNKTMPSRWIKHLLTFTLMLALLVVMLGAYTRLTNAGLGCPDWPGCYGHLLLPEHPGATVEVTKAWTEMAHRYAAGMLALLIVMIGFGLSRKRSLVSLLIISLVLLQAALGMWTVTMKLLPVVVMGHLLGGILVFSLLCCLRLQMSGLPSDHLPFWRFWIGLGVLLVFCQIASGGWVSSNYAGIACTGFPKCHGQWFPQLNFSQGFYLFSPVGANYQGGLLESDARLTIAYVHRVGALITTLYVFSLGFLIRRSRVSSTLRRMSLLAMLLIVAQVSLGIVNVIYLLPIGIAVAHNGVAALLMSVMLMMFCLTKASVSGRTT